MSKQSNSARRAKRAALYRINLKAKKKIKAQWQLQKNKEIIAKFVAENKRSSFNNFFIKEIWAPLWENCSVLISMIAYAAFVTLSMAFVAGIIWATLWILDQGISY